MLERIYVSKTQDSHTIFKSSYNEDSTWVVSDLTSKLSFQKKIFETENLIPDESLLRAQELWFKLFTRINPDYRLASKECILFFIKKFIAQTDFEWAQRSGTAALALQYMNTLMPILAHKNGFETMKDFFLKQVASFERWGHWYLLCHEIYQKFIDYKMIHPQWIPAHLMYESGFSNVWNKKLIFDLGSQMLPVEGELILQLSKELDVQVLIPKNEWTPQFQSTLKAYDVLETLEVEKKAPSFLFRYIHNINSQSRLNFKKMSTHLSEAQDICATLRKWIEVDKIDVSKIAVAAPDIGGYWPVLSAYLKEEGIPVARGLYSTLKTLPSFHQWIAKMQIEVGLKDYYALETDFYSQGDVPIRYEAFSAQYKNIYSLDELKKEKEFKYTFKGGDDSLILVDFLNWALPLWTTQDTELLQNLISRLYQDFPNTIQFTRLEWIQIVDHLASRVEICVEGANRTGIQCLDVISLKDLDVSHVIVLGLSDSSLRKSSGTLVNDFDISYLKNQYGFGLSDVEKMDLEFEVYWNLQDTHKTFELYYAQTDFESRQLAPSRVWFLGAVEQYGAKIPLSIPSESRLFSLQKEPLEKLNLPLVEKRIQKDMGLVAEPWFSNYNPEKLSASQIENYLNCPFINAAQKLFALVDLPTLDLDIDYMTRGNLLHKAAEVILTNYPTLNLTSENVQNVLDEVSGDYRQKIKDPQIWQYQKKKFEGYLFKFVEFERNLRQQLPELVSKYLEQDFSMYLDPKTGDLSKSAFEGAIQLRGRIDRVDVDSQEEVSMVIDYKFDTNRYRHFNSWMEENTLQLLLYMYAIENGALLKPYRAIGAVYYDFKKAHRDKGYLEEEVDGILFQTSEIGRAHV